MQSRTLWDALDHDRKRKARLAVQVGALTLFLVLTIGMLVYAYVIAPVQTGGRSDVAVGARAIANNGRTVELLLRVFVPLGSILLFPLFRRQREAAIWKSLGTVPFQPGMAPETHKALYEASLAAGIDPVPALRLFMSDAVNAFVSRRKQTMHVAVTTEFTKLPRDEQRAAFAMLIGRCNTEITAYASDYMLGMTGEAARAGSRTENVVLPPAEDPAFRRCWIECACAGDREGLRILKEIRPMVALLDRLVTCRTGIPQMQIEESSRNAAFGFLAWPYFDAHRSRDEKLPAKAAMMVAQVIVSEASKGSQQLAYPELIRSQRLQAVSGIEGMFASSVSNSLRDALAQPPAPQDVPAAAVAAVPVTPVVPVVRPVKPAMRPAERISVSCPSCGAGNAPANHTCIACGKRLAG